MINFDQYFSKGLKPPTRWWFGVASECSSNSPKWTSRSAVWKFHEGHSKTQTYSRDIYRNGICILDLPRMGIHLQLDEVQDDRGHGCLSGVSRNGWSMVVDHHECNDSSGVRFSLWYGCLARWFTWQLEYLNDRCHHHWCNDIYGQFGRLPWWHDLRQLWSKGGGLLGIQLSLHWVLLHWFCIGEWGREWFRENLCSLRIIGPSKAWRHFEDLNTPAIYRFFHPSIGGSKILRVNNNWQLKPLHFLVPHFLQEEFSKKALLQHGNSGWKKRRRMSHFKKKQVPFVNKLWIQLGTLSRWWFQSFKHFLFSPLKLGKMNPIWSAQKILQMGWWKTTKLALFEVERLQLHRNWFWHVLDPCWPATRVWACWTTSFAWHVLYLSLETVQLWSATSKLYLQLLEVFGLFYGCKSLRIDMDCFHSWPSQPLHLLPLEYWASQVWRSCQISVEKEFKVKVTWCWYFWIHIWVFPKIGVPPNHPFQ